jgi:flagellar hook-associated protein 2
VLAITDQSKLDDALENNLDEVIDLFTSAGNSSNQYIDFISATSETTVGMSFDIDITQVATHGRFEGSGVTDLATSNITLANSNNRLRLKVDGLLSDEIILTAKTYQSTTELVNEIQTKIDADSKIGNRDVTVEWIDNGDGTGYLQFTSSSYGSTSKIEMETEQTNTAYDILGLTSGTLYEGLDVAGTINGETAEGSGQILTGAEDNENTEGLKIKVTLSEDQMLLGVDGTITITKGVASRLKDFVDSITKSIDGTLDRRIKAYQNQYNELTDRIADIDELLEMRRESLYRQFYEMELVLGELSVQADYLTQQLSSLKTNWKGYSND